MEGRMDGWIASASCLGNDHTTDCHVKTRGGPSLRLVDKRRGINRPTATKTALQRTRPAEGIPIQRISGFIKRREFFLNTGGCNSCTSIRLCQQTLVHRLSPFEFSHFLQSLFFRSLSISLCLCLSLSLKRYRVINSSSSSSRSS